MSEITLVARRTETAEDEGQLSCKNRSQEVIISEIVKRLNRAHVAASMVNRQPQNDTLCT